MATADLSVIGPQGTLPRYLVAGGTQVLAGEPTHNLNTGLTSGVVSVNTYVLVAVDSPVIAASGSDTQRFGGVSLENSLNNTAATPVVLEQFLNCACPVPNVGRLKGAAETSASVDTLTELALLIGDAILIDYAATGAADGGELYTIKEAASANTSGLTLVGGNTATSILEATVHPHAYRNDIAS